MKTKWNLPGFELDTTKLWSGLTPTQDKPSSNVKKAGFYDWPVQISATELASLEQTAKEIRETYEGCLLIGIGGSFLGPAAVHQALRTPEEEEENFPLHWLSNVDGVAIERATYFAKKRKVATVVISKSGGTVETLAGFFHLAPFLDPKGIVTITDPEVGELRRLTKQNGWKSFQVPPQIGGRFSVLTAVGLLPSLLGGVSAQELLSGAKKMREALANDSDNAAFSLAQAKYLLDTQKHRPIQVMMPYSNALQLLAHWYVQLWAESLGKNGKGPTPMGALGTSDQHSLLQLFKEGPHDKILGFLDVAKTSGIRPSKPPFEVAKEFGYLFNHSFDSIAQKASFATETSLNRSQTPTYRLSFEKISAEAIGAFFYFFEAACAYAGELYKIDAFNQPGVEESKQLLKQSLL